MYESSLSSPVARKLLVVEDESFIQSLIAGVLDRAGFEIRTCANAVEAKRLVKSFDPDALVVDIELESGPSGLELIAALNRTHPHLGFVVLSSFRPTASDLAALRRTRYLSKKDANDVDALLQEVEAVLTTQDLKSSENPVAGGLLAKLTPTQLDVLKLVAQGYSNAEIAQRRGSSLRGVEQLIARTYEVLGLSRDGKSALRVQATRIYASEAGMPSSERAR
jgi:DNA-binding NarL/FixJ family response regulator